MMRQSVLIAMADRQARRCGARALAWTLAPVVQGGTGRALAMLPRAWTTVVERWSPRWDRRGAAHFYFSWTGRSSQVRGTRFSAQTRHGVRAGRHTECIVHPRHTEHQQRPDQALQARQTRLRNVRRPHDEIRPNHSWMRSSAHHAQRSGPGSHKILEQGLRRAARARFGKFLNRSEARRPCSRCRFQVPLPDESQVAKGVRDACERD